MNRRQRGSGLFWPARKSDATGLRISAGRWLHALFVVVAAACFVYGVVLAARWEAGSGAFILASATCHAMAIFLIGRSVRLVLSQE